MATVEQNRKYRRRSRRRAIRGFDIEAIRRGSRELFEIELGKFEKQLHTRQIQQLHEHFEDWVFRAFDKIREQLRSIPEEARDRWLNERFSLDRRQEKNQPVRFVCDFLFDHVRESLLELARLKDQNREFRKTIAKVRNEYERRQIILHYAEQLGASPIQLHGDAKAFERWFDEEAVTDRFFKKVGEKELETCFAFDRLARILIRIVQLSMAGHIKEHGSVNARTSELCSKLERLWRRLNFELRIHDAFVYNGDSRVHYSALKCLRMVLDHLPPELPGKLLRHSTLQFLNRTARECNSDVLVQNEALSVLNLLPESDVANIFDFRLSRESADTDDIFVRRHILKLLISRLNRGEQVPVEPAGLVADPSPFVRQKLAEFLFLSDKPEDAYAWERLVLEDESPQVRSAALLCGKKFRMLPAKEEWFLKILAEVLAREKNSFVVRTGMLVSVDFLWDCQRRQRGKTRDLDSSDDRVVRLYQTFIVPQLKSIESTHDDVPLRRYAAQALEKVGLAMNLELLSVYDKLEAELRSIPIGKTRNFSSRQFSGMSDATIGRLLALVSQDDFGFDFRRGWFGITIQRGPRFGFRLWRAIHELRNSATDKRQGHRHTIGRISNARIRSCSQILGELSQTKVPGEPLVVANDGTWRPFLPLLDDFVSVLNMSWFKPATVEFYSSQGVTTVQGPASLGKQLRASWFLNFRFSRTAELRNWDQDNFKPTDYVNRLRELGFKIRFDRHQAPPHYVDHEGDESTSTRRGKSHKDTSVNQFFENITPAVSPAMLAGLPLASGILDSPVVNWLKKFGDYFSSAFENTLEHLVIFASLVFLFVFLRHLLLNFSFRKARRKIPLSIGGWGTRGKSGTERLKAALFGVMGHGLVSKTTGCEAMFIQAYAFGEPLEIPLFRPYDKATIWEQRNLIVLASQMDPSVFLWECMALNPAYVHVLQRQWTCDDIATITNTYPDHEDIQGPAGYDVAKTIAGFAPLKAKLITTEEQMRPYVAEECKKAGSEFQGVGWLESGLVPEDVLERFPYQEHPDNIALVAALGAEFGLEYEYCLKAMADYLVPDLGVLKTHPVAEVKTRKIEFTNGMSANERFGCMGNWKRLGFDQIDPWKDSGTWVTGVVNNRADRVPRSKVFAKIIVDDMSADRYFLIGSNLKGLYGFIKDAWDDRSQDLSLRDRESTWDVEFAHNALLDAARQLRQPTDLKHVKMRLQSMLDGVQHMVVNGDELDSQSIGERFTTVENLESQILPYLPPEIGERIVAYVQELLGAVEEYQRVRQTITGSFGKDSEAAEKLFQATAKKWFFRKLVVVEDYDATGEEVLDDIVRETPPGFTNRIMGMQNIKGTGLDFVYRFQAWDTCHDACQKLLDRNVQVAEAALATLVGMPDIGQLCHEFLTRTLLRAERSPAMQRADLQNQIAQLKDRLKIKRGSTDHSADGPKTAQRRRSEIKEWFTRYAEQYLDVNDSVRRRNNVDVIYADLAAQRISRQRAVVELRKINKRQKGGWLANPKS